MGHDIEFLLGLLGVVVFGVWLARVVRVPYPIVLLGSGLLVGSIPGVPDVELDPDIIFLVFLPPLIHAAAYDTQVRHLVRDARPLAVLSVGAVVVTILAVAWVAHALIGGMTWAVAFVLGAVLSPTDTVAATSVFRRLGVRSRIVTLIEGESLVNDAVALVLYALAIEAATSGSFSLAEGVIDFVVVGTGGAAIGLAVGMAVAWVRKRIDDAQLEVTLTLLTPYLAWIPAEELHVSGVLAAATSGLYVGWKATELSSATVRLQGRGFWTTFVFILESLLFILIGLQFPGVLDALGGQDPWELATYAAAITATVIVTRVVFVMVSGAVDEWLARRFRSKRDPLTVRGRLVVGWAGMRGAVSLAAALAIPLTIDGGAAFPERDLILFLTLCAIGGTLVIQGLTLPLLVPVLGVREEQSSERRKALARFQTVEAALQRVGELTYEDELPEDVVERARSMYTSRARQLAGMCRAGIPVDEEGNENSWRRLRRELLEVERQRLLELRNDGTLSAPVVRDVEQDLDLEAARLTPPRDDDSAAPTETLPVEVPR